MTQSYFGKKHIGVMQCMSSWPLDLICPPPPPPNYVLLNKIAFYIGIQQ